MEDLFRSTGAGCVTSEHDGARRDIHTLNLNHWRLAQNRKEVLAVLRRQLGPSGPWRPAELERVLRAWQTRDADGRLPEYAGVARYHLRRWIRATSAR